MFLRQQRTIVTLDDLVPALTQAFERLGLTLEPIDIAIVFGKLVAECGWPGPAQCCWNWNIGNIRGTSSDGDYTVLASAYEFARADQLPAGAIIIPPPAHVVAPAGMVCYLPSHPSESQRFRAYDDLVNGCDEYAQVIHDKFKDVWRVIEAEDTTPEQVVSMMVLDHYFTGSGAQYLRNVRSGVAWALPRIRIPNTLPAPPDVNAPTTDPGGRFDGPANPLGWADRAERDAADE